MKFRFGAIALALLVVVAATGCGSKKKAAVTTSAAPAVTTTATTTASSGGGSTTTTAPTTTSSSKPTFGSIKNCAQLESIGKKFSAEIQASASGGKFDFTKEGQLLKALADASPSAIHGDFETLATAFGSAAAAYGKLNITAGKTPSPAQLAALEAAGKAFTSPKVVAAEQHLETWASTNCAGFKTTTG